MLFLEYLLDYENSHMQMGIKPPHTNYNFEQCVYRFFYFLLPSFTKAFDLRKSLASSKCQKNNPEMD